MTRLSPKFPLATATKELQLYFPKIDKRVMDFLKKKKVFKIRPDHFNTKSIRFELTRKEVEDIKRLVWMYFRKSEPYPGDIEQ
jgi:hypothetical protein